MSRFTNIIQELGLTRGTGYDVEGSFKKVVGKWKSVSVPKITFGYEVRLVRFRLSSHQDFHHHPFCRPWEITVFFGRESPRPRKKFDPVTLTSRVTDRPRTADLNSTLMIGPSDGEWFLFVHPRQPSLMGKKTECLLDRGRGGTNRLGSSGLVVH